MQQFFIELFFFEGLVRQDAAFESLEILTNFALYFSKRFSGLLLAYAEILLARNIKHVLTSN